VVLFTALIAFEERIAIEKDAFAASDGTLWFAARTQSKPGLNNSAKFDCWTLVSTPKYAAAEIDRVPMQDPKTGAFIPQDMAYLRDGPSSTLLAAFERLLSSSGFGKCTPLPKANYLGGQRWGSAFPAPANVGNRDEQGRGDSLVEVLNVAYDSAPSMALAPSKADASADVSQTNGNSGCRNFLADDDQQIYYASDYVSTRLPGVESAALSALDTARHIASKVLGPQES